LPSSPSAKALHFLYRCRGKEVFFSNLSNLVVKPAYQERERERESPESGEGGGGERERRWGGDGPVGRGRRERGEGEGEGTRTKVSKFSREILHFYTFSIFARIFSILGVQDRPRLFPTLLQYSAAWSAHRNLKVKMCL
jgi:hypothetical protein